ncbi:MAG: nucleotidyl transferase AbiEii/AbiGii toxin family protein [Bacilli bacterium]
MNNFFDLKKEQKQLIITQISNKMGLPVQAIEKDLWVTVILQLVFTLPFADKLIFKGGTSLSKVWNLIKRFSEDIDLAINRTVFDLEGDLTKKQIKNLRKKASLFVRDDVCNALKDKVMKTKLNNFCEIKAEDNGEGNNTYPEPRKIHIYYKSLFDGRIPYLNSEVLLEIGSRSLIEPTKVTKIKSLISSNFSIETSIVNSDVITAVPQKTFLEKSFLLHELFSTNRIVDANRKSRHLYDLERMMDEDFAKKAIKDDVLWNTICHHRKVFTSVKDIDYSLDIRDNICLVPPVGVMTEWKNDYENMRKTMIYGDSLSFEDLIERITILGDLFKNREKSKRNGAKLS